MAIVDTAPDAEKEKTLFGHPRGLTWLFTTEMWERFSYYGMRAILVLYLTNVLLLPGQAENAIGYATIKHLFESLFNGGQPLAVQPFSSLIYGNYTAFVYLTPFFGGLIADRWIGQRMSVIIGGVTMAIAEFTLMSPHLFFIGLLLLIIGNGFFKPNISTQVGGLYKPGDSRIDRAYSIFYVGINVGAFFSPLVCGSLAEDPAWGYKWGFCAAGIGMVIGQIIYILALRTLPRDRVEQTRAGTVTKEPLTGNDWKAIVAIILLCIPTTLFWATYEQQGNTISLWAEQFTNRALIPGVVGWQIPVTWFQSFNPFMIFAFTPLVVWFWGRQMTRGKEPATVTKMALGNFMLALSYLIMAAAAYLNPHGGASWLWLFGFFVVITMGELYLSPIGLALVARVSPPQILSMMMGLWFITSFTGNQLQGYIGSFFSRMDKVSFFLLCAGLGLVAAVLTWIFERPLRTIIESKMAKSGAPNAVVEPQGAEVHPAQ
ncbi:MAG: peptide MFS transporter [Alphaproteobacteria bacterium]|nr:peptide MFS transporter [Alphaproteobacteria bacterium]MBL6936528.1 peptide MFS transporter [Alphaproteobacteria bacterium]MBL7098421.1 peptide MFS transporter [Alphaproteobacteria bacterium]